ncbi:MAG TPA: hypothetical protein VGZ93_12115 [Candidatus Methylacidiphilales bacterium]|jgi:prolyl oligopeptidase|nr:hypothetical protein [Candidatus Methylacidiphilales bacterium]
MGVWEEESLLQERCSGKGLKACDLAAKTSIPESGSPDDPDQFKALHGYSPRHHVKPGTRYSSNPILLRLETQSGHGGDDQVSKTIDYGVDIWSILIQK